MMTDAELAYELADIRSAMLETLTETARILRYQGDDLTQIEGYDGRFDPDAETIVATVASSGFSDAEQIVADRLTDRAVYVVTIPAGTDLKTEDRIRIETRDGASIDPVRDFDVMSVPDDTGEWVRRIVVAEIR